MLQKLELFNSIKEFFLFIAVCVFIFSYSLLVEYNNFKNLTQFDSQIIEATIIKQYTKTKIKKNGKLRTYQVLKLQSDKNFSFYTIANKNFPSSKLKQVRLEIWTGKLTFLEYLQTFFAPSHILEVDKNNSMKSDINKLIESQHKDSNSTQIYQALYTATPLSRDLQKLFAVLGVSHLFAISGFHLGVLATLLFFVLKTPYKFFQHRYFPYRSYKVDSFIIISILLFIYMLFLDVPASLLRAYVMMIIGFILYDRGFKIVSMWTLFLTAILILSFTPRLFFSIGFWLSIAGVFYIFLFLLHFKNLHKIWQFIFIPIWVYLMMLPYSLYIFHTFSLMHPLSIIWTSLFTIFYPLSIVLHLLSQGDVFDYSLSTLLSLASYPQDIELSHEIFFSFLALSLISVVNRKIVVILIFFGGFIFIDSIYNVTQF